MKKLILTLTLVASLTTFAHGHIPPHMEFRHRPHPVHFHHNHHIDGRECMAIVGGMIGGIVVNSIVQPKKTVVVEKEVHFIVR